MDRPTDERHEFAKPDPSMWVDRYGDYLYRYAYSRLRDVESAEEVVQESFVAGLRSIKQYAGRGAERAWLLAILKRKIVDYVRQRNRSTGRRATQPDDDLSEVLFDHKGNWRADARAFGPQPSAGIEHEEFWEILRRCLKALPQRQADVFTLRVMDGRSSREVCNVLDITPSNLWVLMYRARLGLSNCITSKFHTTSERQP